MANPKDRETIQSLRLSIKEALDSLNYAERSPSVLETTAILEAAYEYTDPELLDKDCGCG
jgi:hypothetical protein